jgi:hypothetical protein
MPKLDYRKNNQLYGSSSGNPWGILVVKRQIPCGILVVHCGILVVKRHAEKLLAVNKLDFFTMKGNFHVHLRFLAAGPAVFEIFELQL